MKLALENSAIVARLLVSFPIIVLVPITDTSNSLPVQHVRWNELGSLDFFGPALNHWYAPIEDAF